MAKRSKRLLPLLRLIQGQERSRAAELTDCRTAQDAVGDATERADAAQQRTEADLRHAMLDLHPDGDELERARVLAEAAEADLATWLARARTAEAALNVAEARYEDESAARRRLERALEKWDDADNADASRREYRAADDDATRPDREAA